MKSIVLICDGMGDIPTKEHPNTPLEEANTPNFDKIASMGRNGIMYPVGPGIVPGSDTGHLSILGYDLSKYYPGRGPLEAIGAEIKLEPGEVAFRANIATIDENFNVIDRRAGRISGDLSELVDAINSIKLPVDFIFHHTVEHRGALVLKSGSDKVTDSDPHKTGVKVLEVKPKDNSGEAKRTSEILNEFTRKSHEVLKNLKLNEGRKLPANVILLRGAGEYKKAPTFEEIHGWKGAAIAAVALVRGVAKYAGMDLLSVEGMTGNAKTNIKGKFEVAVKALENHDFVLINVKATDLFGHDGNFEGKKEFIEKIDKQLPILMKEIGKINLVVTADHSTPVSKMAHSADPVPIAFVGPKFEPDSVVKFGEKECKKGSIGTIRGMDVTRILKG